MTGRLIWVRRCRPCADRYRHRRANISSKAPVRHCSPDQRHSRGAISGFRDAASHADLAGRRNLPSGRISRSTTSDGTLLRDTRIVISSATDTRPRSNIQCSVPDRASPFRTESLPCCLYRTDMCGLHLWSPAAIAKPQARHRASKIISFAHFAAKGDIAIGATGQAFDHRALKGSDLVKNIGRRRVIASLPPARSGRPAIPAARSRQSHRPANAAQPTAAHRPIWVIHPQRSTRPPTVAHSDSRGTSRSKGRIATRFNPSQITPLFPGFAVTSLILATAKYPRGPALTGS